MLYEIGAPDYVVETLKIFAMLEYPNQEIKPCGGSKTFEECAFLYAKKGEDAPTYYLWFNDQTGSTRSVRTINHKQRIINGEVVNAY